MRRGLFLFVSLLALPSWGLACSIESRRAGEPLQVPTSVVEVRILALADEPYEHRKGRFTEGQRGRFEVTRSLVGSVPVGTVLERHWQTASCFGNRLARDTRVLMADFDGEGFLWFYELVGADETFDSVHGRFADENRTWRASARPSLARVRLSGDIDDAVAERLIKDSGFARGQACDVAVAQDFVQVACGSPPAGESIRARVIFEDVGGRWAEVLRWDPADLAPAPPATAAP